MSLDRTGGSGPLLLLEAAGLSQRKFAQRTGPGIRRKGDG